VGALTSPWKLIRPVVLLSHYVSLVTEHEVADAADPPAVFTLEEIEGSRKLELILLAESLLPNQSRRNVADTVRIDQLAGPTRPQETLSVTRGAEVEFATAISIRALLAEVLDHLWI
jgi:hypothetical protein